MIYPSAIESAEAFGAASLEFQIVRPPSIVMPRPVAVLPLAIEAGSFGQTLVGAALELTGFGGEAFGQSTMKIYLAASAVASGEAFGTAQIVRADSVIAVLPIQ